MDKHNKDFYKVLEIQREITTIVGDGQADPEPLLSKIRDKLNKNDLVLSQSATSFNRDTYCRTRIYNSGGEVLMESTWPCACEKDARADIRIAIFNESWKQACQYSILAMFGCAVITEQT